jgi:hypothetical protein
VGSLYGTTVSQIKKKNRGLEAKKKKVESVRKREGKG